MNTVHIEGKGGLRLHPAVTSREELLAAAKKIAVEEGLSQISVRRVASACGVAVGSIYNYFPTKGELLLAVVESFWKEVFHGIAWPEITSEGFPAFLGELYIRFHCYLGGFRRDWLAPLADLPPSDRQRGKDTEAFYFQHIRQGLARALEQDRRISPDMWSDGLTPSLLAGFVFDNLLAALRRGDPDCRLLCRVLRRLLYRD